MPCWSRGPLAAFGTVATGPDPERDRIVSAAVVVQHAPGAVPASRHWLSGPGAPPSTAPSPGAVSAGAPTSGTVSADAPPSGTVSADAPPSGAASSASAADGRGPDGPPGHGRRPGLVVEETARALAAQAAAGRPLVVMNAPFGLTLLDRELRRHRSASLADYLGGRSLCVLDPRVLDAHLDGSPAGRSTLAELCARYGVLRTGPHGAEEQAEPGQQAEAYADGDGDGEPRAAGAGRPADDRCTRADASWEAGLCTHGDPHAHPSARADPCAQADPCARAVAEAEAALAVLRALGPRFAARTGPLSAAELHARQAVWHAARARGLGSWFAGSGSAEPVDPAWPLRPRLPAAA